MAQASTTPVPASAPGGAASDTVRAAAEEIVSYIQGEVQRSEDAMQSTGQVLSRNQRKQMLVDEVTGKIRAAFPAPAYPPEHK